ncbi:MAG: glucosaminidase domain-containing protein [Saprospiraceae bacterium]|nr:glucosaminidase domain-containing protein [Saprospiraceae bacterium]
MEKLNNEEPKQQTLKIFYKQENEHTQSLEKTTFPRFEDNVLSDYFNRLQNAFERVSGVFQHRFEKYTFGIGTKISRVTAIKICILSIIMFLIFRKDIATPINSVNFVAETMNEEKTHANKHKKSFVTPAALGSVVDDLSPASPEDLREVQVREYIERFSDVAVGEMDKFGIPASISMAQAIIESRSGTSSLAVRNNNHFGIKCFSKSCPKGHCSNFTDDHHKDFFRQYKGPWESWREHSHFLMKYRYRNLTKHGKNYRSWAQGLKEYGYATDNSYDKKLISVIEKYDLHKLDDL